ncbi:hypothetical protein L249_2921, partial [Ophiocordyceps polyrhachis-furcata BCC 54312]
MLPRQKRDREQGLTYPFCFQESVTTTIHFTDGIKEREAFYLKLLKSSLDDEKLSDLRTNIAGLTGSIEMFFSPLYVLVLADVGSQFSLPVFFSVQEYLTECLGVSSHGRESERKTILSNYQINTTEARSLDVYMRDSSLAQKLDSVTRHLPRRADISSVLDAEKLSRIKRQVDDVAFKQLTGTAAKYVPELEQKDWAVISESNALCYGIRVLRAKVSEEVSSKTKDKRGVPVGIERARFPAFYLKKRTIMSDSIPSSAVEGVKLDLRVPDYIIDDKSYVSIYETETEMQSSMATSSFSELDVAAAGFVPPPPPPPRKSKRLTRLRSGNIAGFSGGVSASFASASSEAATSSSSNKSKKVTIAHNFPRVTLFLDSRSLELTPECEDALRRVKSKDDFYKFQDIY